MHTFFSSEVVLSIMGVLFFTSPFTAPEGTTPSHPIDYVVCTFTFNHVANHHSSILMSHHALDRLCSHRMVRIIVGSPKCCFLRKAVLFRNTPFYPPRSAAARAAFLAPTVLTAFAHPFARVIVACLMPQRDAHASRVRAPSISQWSERKDKSHFRLSGEKNHVYKPTAFGLKWDKWIVRLFPPRKRVC